MASGFPDAQQVHPNLHDDLMVQNGKLRVVAASMEGKVVSWVEAVPFYLKELRATFGLLVVLRLHTILHLLELGRKAFGRLPTSSDSSLPPNQGQNRLWERGADLLTISW